LTLENGKEFSDYKKIESELGIDIYFADTINNLPGKMLNYQTPAEAFHG